VELNVVSISTVAAALAVTVESKVNAPALGFAQDGKPDPELVSTWPLFPVAPFKVNAVVRLADAITGEVKVTPDAIKLLVIAVSPILSPVIVADAILAPVIVPSTMLFALIAVKPILSPVTAPAASSEVLIEPSAIAAVVIALAPISAEVIVLFAISAKVISPLAMSADEITFDVILAAMIFESAIILIMLLVGYYI
jgi:hypothetical protein